MSQTMELTRENLETIGGYVRQHLASWMREVTPPPQQTDPVLLERIVRVEEELRAQRELMKQGFEQVDKRFELVDRRLDDQRLEMNARFEQIDKRFEQVDKRFDQADRHMNRWMTAMTLVLALVGIAVTLTQVLL